MLIWFFIILLYSELMSLLKFIMPELLENSTATLKKIFKLSSSESDFARQRVAEAKSILDPFVMRRIKSDVLKGKTSFIFYTCMKHYLDLPPKTDETIKVKMTDTQTMYYNEILDQTRTKLDPNDPKAMKNYWIQLRKVMRIQCLSMLIFYNIDCQPSSS